MDECLIIQFATKSEAQSTIVVINQIAAAWWASQGYTVIEGQLIGKNALTGQDMPDNVRTTTWDVPKESPDNTWYIVSPTSSPNFINWRDYVPEGFVIPNDEILPENWEVSGS